jgi:glycosyltransferase involved in cell wall biosynthesis
MHELLNPHSIDQSAVFESQFNGMTDTTFGYNEYQETREQLIRVISESLTIEDKEFLLAFAKGKPNWSRVDYSKFSAIRWKLLNINKLKDNNPQKYNEQMDSVKQVLFR